MATRAISVKVSTVKVINALETKLATIKETYANQDKLEAEFQTVLTAWNKSVIDYALSKIAEATNFRTSVSNWKSTMNIDFDVPTNEGFPESPERNFEQMYQSTYREMVEELENAIRILKMTDEETVSTATFKTIAQYL